MGKPGLLQFTGSQRVGRDWAAEEQQLSVWSVDSGPGAVGTERGEGQKRLHGQGETPCPRGPASPVL